MNARLYFYRVELFLSTPSLEHDTHVMERYTQKSQIENQWWYCNCRSWHDRSLAVARLDIYRGTAQGMQWVQELQLYAFQEEFYEQCECTSSVVTLTHEQNPSKINFMPLSRPRLQLDGSFIQGVNFECLQIIQSMDLILLQTWLSLYQSIRESNSWLVLRWTGSKWDIL